MKNYDQILKIQVCPYTVFGIYLVLEQIYVQFCLEFQINFLLIKFWHSIRVIVRFPLPSYLKDSPLRMLLHFLTFRSAG